MADRKNNFKTEWHRLPKEALEIVAMVFQLNSVFKYPDVAPGQPNWQQPPYFNRELLEDCMDRHTFAIKQGELFDAETKLFHSAHKACNALMEVQYDVKGWFAELNEHDAALRVRLMREEWTNRMIEEYDKREKSKMDT